MRYCSILLLLLLFLNSVSGEATGRPAAQEKWDIQYPDDSILNKITDIDERLRIFTEKDTLRGYSAPRKIDESSYLRLRSGKSEALRDRNGLLIVPFEYEPFQLYQTFRDTIILDPVMLPVIFDGKLLPDDLDFGRETKISDGTPDVMLIERDSIVAPELYSYDKDKMSRYKLIDINSTQAPSLWKAGRTEETRKTFFVHHPEQISSNALTFEGSSVIAKTQIESKNPFKELVAVEDAIEIARPEVETFKVKQVFWKFGGEHNLTVSQRAYSHNWNPKTNNSFFIQNLHILRAAYRKNKVSFNHELEWRFNAQSVSLSDGEKENNPDYNSFIIGDDWLKTRNTLGFQSFLRNWAYTITLEMSTPLFNKYPQNNKNIRVQGLFSPFYLNFGIGGLQYSLNKESKRVRGRKISLSINAAPLSFTLKHVGSRKVYVNNNHGVKYDDGLNPGDEGYRPRYTMTSLGSTINGNVQYNFNSYTFIRSRLKYETDYSKVYVENETTVEFKLNRYLSTSFYVYTKFDDGVGIARKDSDLGYFSFNEVLGFGLSYTWN